MIAHLLCRSYYSFLDGANSPEELIHHAVAQGVRHLALTDYAGVYGAVDFARKAEAEGVHPVVGAEVPLTDEETAAVLCRDADGYAALCRELTLFHLEADYPAKAAVVERIARLAEHNWVLLDSPKLAEKLGGAGIAGHLALAVTRHQAPGETRTIRKMTELAARFGLPLVAVNRVCFAGPDDFQTHRLLAAIRLRGTVGRLHPGDTASPEAWLKPPALTGSLFAELPQALTNAERIAESCTFRFTTGRALHPPFPVPDGTTAAAILREKAFAGLTERFGSPPQRARKQLEYELSVIHQTGFDEYFLIVKDIVDFAASRSIPLTGRGSAGGSLTAFSLGITHVDPLVHNLSFERFLNPRRTDPPDIDIDFCWRRRPEVIRFLYDKYGLQNTAMLSTHVRMAGRGALRETARALGMGEAEISRFTRHIPHHDARHIDQVLAEIPECRNIPFHLEPFRSVIAWAKKIAGHPRHLGLHPCGIVLSRVPLERVTPLQMTASGFPATQLEMRQAEDVGLLKIDILGQRALSVVADVEAMIGSPRLKPLSSDRLGKPSEVGHYGEANDAATWELIRSGKTLGCFQIESPGMRSLLKKLQPRDLETVIAASSVIRPGPSDAGMLREYILRYHGKRPVTHLHPALGEILKDTLGIMVYQEDILRTAEAVAGMTAEEADMLRRAMSAKRSAEAMRALRDTFITKAMDRGSTHDVAKEIWRRMETFSGYAFCKAHSASYAVISRLMAWMKAHHPAEFFAAMMDNGGGFYQTDVYLADARRFGVPILPPDLNRSREGFTVEPIPPRPALRPPELQCPGEGEDRRSPAPGEIARTAIRVGLARVRNLGSDTLQRILSRRDEIGAFQNLRHFICLCHPSIDEAKNLIKCGAADGLGRNRPQLLWELQLFPAFGRADHRKPDPGSLLADAPALTSTGSGIDEIPAVDDYSFTEKLRLEAEILELHVSGHPLDLWRDRLSGIDRIQAANLASRRNHPARLVGRLVTTRRVFTKTRQYMKFLTLEDETDLFEAVLFPESYQRWGEAVTGPGVYVVEGKVADEFGSLSIEADFVCPIERYRKNG